MPCFQKYNKHTKRYVKYKVMPSGKTKITNVKEKQPTVPFAGVKVKRN